MVLLLLAASVPAAWSQNVAFGDVRQALSAAGDERPSATIRPAGILDEDGAINPNAEWRLSIPYVMSLSGARQDEIIVKTALKIRRLVDVDANDPNRDHSFAQAALELEWLVQYDPTNGYAYYLGGKLQERRRGASGIRADFESYLTEWRRLPADAAKVGAGQQGCYTDAGRHGYCTERTADIGHMLANLDYAEAFQTSDCAKVKNAELHAGLAAFYFDLGGFAERLKSTRDLLQQIDILAKRLSCAPTR